MFYCTISGQYIQEGTAFEINGIQYPSNWLNLSTPEEKSSLGLEEVIATNERGDDKYYWVSETLNGPELTYTNTPKELKDGANNSVGLITSCTNQILDTAYKLLLPTDWMVIRKVERNVDIPADTTTYREAVITESTRLTTAIGKVKTVEKLIDVMNSQNWPSTGV